MTPYYEESGIRIFLGDNQEILPELGRYDLCLTDPPYGIGRDGSKPSTGPTGGGRKAYTFSGWDTNRPDKTTFDLMRDLADTQIIWGGNYFADLLPPTQKWLVWDKGQRIAQSDGELAWTSMEGALRIFTLNRMAIQMDGARHPTQKPLALIKWCLSLVPAAKTVLDPFLGSGTTLVACKDMGISCDGIELHEPYAEIAANRLRQSVLEFA